MLNQDFKATIFGTQAYIPSDLYGLLHPAQDKNPPAPIQSDKDCHIGNRVTNTGPELNTDFSPTTDPPARSASLDHTLPNLPSTRINRRSSRRSQKDGPTIADLVDHAGDLLPHHRVAHCGKIVVHDRHDVPLQYDEERACARYRNVAPCGSKPACPRCAAEAAAEEARSLAWACSDPRFTPVLVTFTAAHHLGDHRAEWDPKFSRACDLVKSGRSWEELAAAFGIKHTVWGRDITHNPINGWHPHRHYIFFLTNDLDRKGRQRLEHDLRRRFMHVAGRLGLKVTYTRGVKVQAQRYSIDEYIAKYGRPPRRMKWDIEHEVALPTFKSARGDGLTPFELLAASYAGDKAKGDLYKEYVTYMKGRKMIQWSRGAEADLLHGGRPLPDPLPIDPSLEHWRPVITFTIPQFNILCAERLNVDLLKKTVEFHGDPERVNAWLTAVGYWAAVEADADQQAARIHALYGSDHSPG